MNVLAAHDVKAAVDFLTVLVVVDPKRAEKIHRTLLVGLDIAEEANRA